VFTGQFEIDLLLGRHRSGRHVIPASCNAAHGGTKAKITPSGEMAGQTGLPSRRAMSLRCFTLAKWR